MYVYASKMSWLDLCLGWQGGCWLLMVFDFVVVVDPDNEVTVGCVDFIGLDAIYQVKTSKVNCKCSSLEGFPVLRGLVLSCSGAIMSNCAESRIASTRYFQIDNSTSHQSGINRVSPLPLVGNYWSQRTMTRWFRGWDAGKEGVGEVRDRQQLGLPRSEFRLQLDWTEV